MSGVFTNTFVYLVKTDHVDAFIDVFGNEGIYGNIVPMGIINGNGNDGFQVRLKVGSVVVDQVWLEDGTYSYENSYWYRKHGTGPDGGWFPSAWETPGNDALEGLDQDGLQAAVPFGTYAVTWQGITSDWSLGSNWSTGIVPSYQTNVLIPDTLVFFPAITNLPGNPATCMNLVLADTACLTVNAGKALTVSGNLVLDSLANEGPGRGLILKSDDASMPAGSLILKGGLSGPARAEIHLEKNNSWHFLSSPVGIQPFQPVFVPVPVDQSFDLYYWNENSALSDAWINARDGNGNWNMQFEEAFIPGKGYLIAYSPLNPGDSTRTFCGLLNSGDLEIPLDHSENHWNLLGNPYPCALDWASGGISKGAVAAGTMYIWDQSLNDNLGGYRAHNGITGVPEGTTSVIPAMQGFFVQSLDTGCVSVDITDDEPLVHSTRPFYKNVRELPEKRIRLKIRKGALSDETLVYFDPEATNQFDPEFDAEKLFNLQAGCPEIYSVSDPYHYLCMNILAEEPVSVPLGISFQAEDTLLLSAFDFDGIPDETGIFLEDKLLNCLINFREQSEYSFFHHSFQEETRFTLHFMDAASHPELQLPDAPGFWCSGNGLFLSNPSNTAGTCHVFALDGRLVEEFEISGGSQVVRLNVPAGLYLVYLSVPGRTITGKAFIN